MLGIGLVWTRCRTLAPSVANKFYTNRIIQANLRTMFVSECGNEPFIYVTIDNGMCSVALKREVNGSKVVFLLREVT